MKKTLFTLAIFVMALGNVALAQQKLNIKANEKKIVFRHYGVRNDDIRPSEAICTTTDFDETYRITYSYDEYDYYLSQMLLEMDFGYGWSPLEMIAYEYDFSGSVLEKVDYEWEDGDWMESAKATYTYSADGMEVVYQYCENGTWYNDVKEVYNFIGDMTTILFWEWNGNTWSSSELHTYTNTDTSVEVLKQYMQGGAWQNDEKEIYKLDFNGNVTEIFCQDWVNNTWVNDERTTYNYENDVYTSMLVEDWENGAWRDEYRYSFVYDDGNAVHGECVEYLGGQWIPANGDIEMAYNYNDASDEYYGYTVEVTYLDLTSVGENSLTANFKVYPNPAMDEISIQTENFGKAEVYSAMGQKVMESTSNSINVSQLEAGIYLLKVFDLDGNSETQRIVKE